MQRERWYSVWVGALEVNDHYLTLRDAEKLAQAWQENGYDDVVIEDEGWS